MPSAVVSAESISDTIDSFTSLDKSGDRVAMNDLARRLGKEQPALLQTAARDTGLRAVVSEGAGLRSAAEQAHMPDTPREPIRWIAPITMETAAGVVLSDHMPPTDLADLMPRIAPRPVLLIRGMEGNADETLAVRVGQQTL